MLKGFSPDNRKPDVFRVLIKQDDRMPKKRKKSRAEPNVSERPAHRVRLPGFLIEDEVGLGDLIKKATYAMGIRPCSGCERRAAALNRWITFSR
jgi:hypothetical protein